MHAVQNNIWMLTTNGEYSVASTYIWLQGGDTTFPLTSIVWNCLSMPKHKMIFWLMVHGRLLTKDMLLKLNMHIVDPICVCGDAEETINHICFMLV